MFVEIVSTMVRDVTRALAYPPVERSRCSKMPWDPTSWWSSARDEISTGVASRGPLDSSLVIQGGPTCHLLFASRSWWFEGRESPRCSVPGTEGSSCACSMDGHARREMLATVGGNEVRSVNGTCLATFSARCKSWRKGEDLDSRQNHHQYFAHASRGFTSVLRCHSYLHR